jgi:hypothetical protein
MVDSGYSSILTPKSPLHCIERGLSRSLMSRFGLSFVSGKTAHCLVRCYHAERLQDNCRTKVQFGQGVGEAAHLLPGIGQGASPALDDCHCLELDAGIGLAQRQQAGDHTHLGLIPPRCRLI